MPAFQWIPDALGLIWGLAGGFFNWWLTKKLFVKDMSNKRILALVFLKPLTHLIILGCAVFVSLWFMVLAAAGDLLTLGVMFVKNYLDGRR
jgi:H+/Cl- antiporter ClcA